MLFFKRVPFFLYKASQEHCEKEHVVGNHAAPGGDKSHIKKLGEDKSSEDTDTPHSHYVIDKRFFCSANALHKSLDYDRETIERFRNRNHAENG